MKFPLVLSLATGGTHAAVACQVLGSSKLAFYAWKAAPVTDRDRSDAYLIDAAVYVHRDDTAFGYRFIADEFEDQGFSAGESRVPRLCSSERIWFVFAKKRGLARKAGPPVHDYHVRRDFTATAPDRLWPTDLTEHRTDEGNLYLCAIKDLYSNRIVGYSMIPVMKASLSVAALHNAIMLRCTAIAVRNSPRTPSNGR